MVSKAVKKTDVTSQDTFCQFFDFRKTENNIFKVLENSPFDHRSVLSRIWKIEQKVVLCFSGLNTIKNTHRNLQLQQKSAS